MWDRVLAAATGFGGGILAALVTFKLKLATIDSRLDKHDVAIELDKRERAEIRRLLKESLDAIARRQLAELKLMAAIARKLGMTERYDDLVVEYLSTEKLPGQQHNEASE
jgi:hypothetical protein